MFFYSFDSTFNKLEHADFLTKLNGHYTNSQRDKSRWFLKKPCEVLLTVYWVISFQLDIHFSSILRWNDSSFLQHKLKPLIFALLHSDIIETNAKIALQRSPSFLARSIHRSIHWILYDSHNSCGLDRFSTETQPFHASQIHYFKLAHSRLKFGGIFKKMWNRKRSTHLVGKYIVLLQQKQNTSFPSFKTFAQNTIQIQAFLFMNKILFYFRCWCGYTLIKSAVLFTNSNDALSNETWLFSLFFLKKNWPTLFYMWNGITKKPSTSHTQSFCYRHKMHRNVQITEMARSVLKAQCFYLFLSILRKHARGLSDICDINQLHLVFDKLHWGI